MVNVADGKEWTDAATVGQLQVELRAESEKVIAEWRAELERVNAALRAEIQELRVRLNAS
ncbi:hypothetical protein [Burkholderia cenocepacia]|uniref:hypothetical protein n=1 Tax=Burkholderia cenocepacia TaxID=95486 RepID=UPI00098131FA